MATAGAAHIAFLVAASLALHGCGGPSPAPSPTPGPGPSPGPVTTTIPCSTAFKGCAAQLTDSDDAGCFVQQQDDATTFAGCDSALESHFTEYGSKKGDVKKINELVLGGATGTCLTALRYLYSSVPHPLCPMPLPPLLEDISPGADAFNLFTLGDWGPTPAGETWGSCPCELVPTKECRLSLFNVLERAPGLCTADTWEKGNQAQDLVANAMAQHAEEAVPVAVISLGDNFYLGGIPTPYNLKQNDSLHVNPEYAFTTTWHDVYLANGHGNKLNVPWLAIFGNHDYGGAGCQADWQVQIDFTKKDPTKQWRMPYTYYKQRIKAKSYDVDIFMLEVNQDDINDMADHGICHQKYCGALKGDEAMCKQRMMSKINMMYDWLEAELRASIQEGVRWRIFAGHFPFGVDADKITSRIAKQYGVALYISGHTHSQIFHDATDEKVPIFTSGAGGGYRKEGDGDYYGFGKLAMTKDKITVSLLNEDVKVTSSHEIPYQAPPPLPAPTPGPTPSPGPAPAPTPGGDTCTSLGCVLPYDDTLACQCNSECHNHDNCCADYDSHCGDFETV